MGNITFLGVEGSGKTVLTMALVNLFKAHEAEGWFLRPETRSAFRFVEQVPPVLEPGSLPHQTTELRHLAMSVVKDGEVQRVFDILDYPGEIYRLAFLDAKDDPDPATFQARVAANREEIRALLGHLQSSDRVYVLFNLADAQDLAHNAQNLDAVWVTNACLDYLHRLPSHPEIALLLTQIDLYGNLDDPNLNARRIAQQALPLITRNFPNLTIQAVSALGPASGPFGTDKIVAECLKDTPAVWVYKDPETSPEMQNFLQAVQAFMRETESLKELKAAYQKADAAYRSLRRAIKPIQNTAPWFYRSEGHLQNIVEVGSILKDWKDLSTIYRRDSLDFQRGRVGMLFFARTDIGNKWRQVLLKRNIAFRKERCRTSGYIIGGIIGVLMSLLSGGNRWDCQGFGAFLLLLVFAFSCIGLVIGGVIGGIIGAICVREHSL